MVPEDGGRHRAHGGPDYQCAVVLPADAEHLPAVAEEHEEAGEPADDRLQSGSGGASVSGAHGGAERGSGSHGRAAGVRGPGSVSGHATADGARFSGRQPAAGAADGRGTFPAGIGTECAGRAAEGGFHSGEEVMILLV